MLLRFACGRFSISVTGPDAVQTLIPNSWNTYEQLQAYNEQDILIHLQENELPEFNGSDGWHLAHDLPQKQAVYVSNGKTILSLLQSEGQKRVAVSICRLLDSYVRIGIQYGMLAVLYQKCIGLHGVTLLCNDEIVVLSAPSGTGKTTLSHLLESYSDAIVINGDFALLSVTETEVVFEPTPFCGTSRRCLNHRVRVDRIVFLEQSRENCWHDCNGREALARMMSNIFVPAWDNRMRTVVQENAIKALNHVKVNCFAFSPYREAANMFSGMLKSKAI